ncbi:AN1-type zinc finger protein 2B isoform X4 [Onychostruthus taczanowskii]|uniref:AN1-type zinc finger protein 2B isoform X4 n=1 Tax=Onychostruthus taczanowskii TaxID=356909 RepID=UPI001B80D676|nr:AN1-type zinc finger protein 2B isoform X4 [Onychostruthus taczanowskii]
MEFPDLGAHCSWPACQRLDFLPLKCDACEQIFCTDHIAYAQHDCTSAYKKDVQVPVCPLCNTPVPVRRGEMPDVVVGEHIDRDCKSDPAQRKRKIFTNKCLKPGCKQKEMMKVICDQCHKNYCLKHRHPLDHDCSGAGHPLSKAGHAAVTRAQASSSKIVTASSSGAARPADSSSSLACARARKRHCSELWRCPWQSRHAAQHSNPAHRRRRIWHWPRHCQRAKPSTSSRSGRHTVQSHPTAACRRQVRRGVPADTASCL